MFLKQLANFITGLSLSCGFLSIIFSLEGHFTFASWAIIFSVLFDGIDGQIAKKITTPTEFGKELDSLVDVICFGLAPSILGYVFIYKDFYVLATLALFIYLVSSVTRLAKYNITPKEELINYFYGLPTTAGGGMLASFVLIYRKKGTEMIPQFVPFVFLFIVLILAILMISRIRYLNLDGINQVFGKQTKLISGLLFIVIILAAIFRKAGVTLFSLFLLYLIFSPSIVKRLNSKV